MTFGTYLRDQKRDVSSKFHMVRDQLELTYELIQEQVYSVLPEAIIMSSHVY